MTEEIKPMEYIAPLWEIFKNKIIAEDAPEYQIISMRRAFYAGFSAMLHCLYEIRRVSEEEQNPQLMEELIHQFMEDIDHEMRSFLQLLAMGIV